MSLDNGLTPEEERARKRIQAEQARATRAAQRDLRAVLSTPAGRRILWGILEDARVFQGSFTTDAGVTAFNEGQRAVGLKLLERITDASPKAFYEMMEASNEKQEGTNDDS